MVSVLVLGGCSGSGDAKELDVSDVTDGISLGDHGMEPADVRADVRADVQADVQADVHDIQEEIHADVGPQKPFLSPCEDHSECASGWCAEGKDSYICTQQCNDDCPDGMSCRTMLVVNEEPIALCTDAHLTLCHPCDFRVDCTHGNQFPDARCHSWGTAGSYCITPCHDQTPCPDGYTCTEFKLGSDFDFFCTPDSGECTCDGRATTDQLSTTCTIPSGLGDCEGIRYCGSDGLTECDAKPPVSESCNGHDDDCDGSTDEGFSDCDGDYIKDCVDLDQDNDGVLEDGDKSGVRGDSPCSEGNTENCDDNCGACLKNPDQIDSDNNGVGDLCELDEDNDGYSNSTGDCDDQDPQTFPGANESCNGKDDNCDGEIDEEGATLCTPYLRDDDQDGYGLEEDSRCLCGPSDFYTATMGPDCDDQNPLVHPSATESCDEIDNNCDSKIDPPDSENCITFYADSDGDGFGGANSSACLCVSTGEFPTVTHNDCDDTNAWINIHGLEVCNAQDDDCDGTTDIAPSLIQTCPPDCANDLTCAKSCNIAGDCVTTCGTGQSLCFEGEYLPCDAPTLSFCKDPETGCNQEYSICGDCPYKSEELCNGIDDDCDWNTDESFPAQECALGGSTDLCAGTQNCDQGIISCAPTSLPEDIPASLLDCAEDLPALVLTPSDLSSQDTHVAWAWTPSEITHLTLSYNDNYCAGATCAQTLPCGGKIWKWGPIDTHVALQTGTNTLRAYSAASGDAAPCDTANSPVVSSEFTCDTCN